MKNVLNFRKAVSMILLSSLLINASSSFARTEESWEVWRNDMIQIGINPDDYVSAIYDALATHSKSIDGVDISSFKKDSFKYKNDNYLRSTTEGFGDIVKLLKIEVGDKIEFSDSPKDYLLIVGFNSAGDLLTIKNPQTLSLNGTPGFKLTGLKAQDLVVLKAGGLKLTRTFARAGSYPKEQWFDTSINPIKSTSKSLSAISKSPKIKVIDVGALVRLDNNQVEKEIGEFSVLIEKSGKDNLFTLLWNSPKGEQHKYELEIFSGDEGYNELRIVNSTGVTPPISVVTVSDPIRWAEVSSGDAEGSSKNPVHYLKVSCDKSF